jgi:hypothetical protein
VQVDRAQAAAGRAIVGGVLVPEEDDDDLSGVDGGQQGPRRIAGRGVVGEAGLGRAWPARAAGVAALAGFAGLAVAVVAVVAEGLVVDEPPTALAAASRRAAAALEASTALFALATSLARPVTPGGVTAGSPPVTGLGRSTRNHTTAKTSATMRTMRKGRLILSTSPLSAAKADS